jgi:hypothetical protein
MARQIKPMDSRVIAVLGSSCFSMFNTRVAIPMARAIPEKITLASSFLTLSSICR